MARIRVLLLLLVALGGVICNASKTKEKEMKRATKPVEFKKIEKKSTNGKREPAELAELYSVGQKEEPFRPIYQFHYPGAPLKTTTTNYVTAATNSQSSFNKPEAVIQINAGRPHDPSSSNGDNNAGSRSITNLYKTEGSIQYAPSSYKPNSEDGPQYASSSYQGPFAAASHQAPVGEAGSHPGPFYSAAPVQHSSASVALPLHYGGIEQPLAPHPNQQNQYTIAFPGEYMRHYQQNLAAPFPLRSAQMVHLIYAHNSGSPQTASPAALKDHLYKQGTVQYVTLAPHLAPPQGTHSLVAGPGVITYIIPYYGPSGPNHQQAQQAQQPPPAAFYYGAYNQQLPPNSLAYTTTLPHQQQSIQKQQIYGPIQITAVGTAAPVPFKPVQQQQQLQHQTLTQFYQHYHPGAAGYTRHSQSPPGSNGSGGSSNPVEVSAYEAGSSSAPKQGPLYSSPSSTNIPGSTYSGAAGSSGGKTFNYGVDPSYEGPMYAHPGAMQYGTHLLHPSRNVVQIGFNPVTAGSAAIAGISPPSYHPQQQSPANNSHGSRGSSSSVSKFA